MTAPTNGHPYRPLAVESDEGRKIREQAEQIERLRKHIEGMREVLRLQEARTIASQDRLARERRRSKAVILAALTFAIGGLVQFYLLGAGAR